MASRKSKTSADAQQPPAEGAVAEKKPRRARRADGSDAGQDKAGGRKRKARGSEATGKLVRAGEQSPPEPITELAPAEPALPAAPAPAEPPQPVHAQAAAAQHVPSPPAPEAPVEPPPEPVAATLKSRVDAPDSTVRSAPAQSPVAPAAPFPVASLQGLPFPIGKFAVLWSEASDGSGRMQAAVRAMTAVLQVLSAAQLGSLSKARYRDRIDVGAYLAAGGYLDDRLSAVAWARLAFGLSSKAAGAGQGPMAATAQALGDAGGLASEIEHALLASVAASSASDSLANELAELLRTLAAVCKPMRSLSLMAIEARDASNGDDRVQYRAHRYDGASADPQPVSLWAARPLAQGWCYLFDGPEVAVSLAPIVFAVRCTACGGIEACAAERLGPMRAQGRALHCRSECAVPRFRWPLQRATSIWGG